MAGLGSSGGRTWGTRDIPLDGRIAIVARVRTRGTIPLLTQADHPSLVARQLELLLAEHCNRWSRRRGGTRRAIKKSVRLPAQRKGMGPRGRWTKVLPDRRGRE